jgi:uncharacterized membrane protein YjjP (DUF1212 family)
MTRSKIDLATHLLKLCNDTTTKPEDLAKVMTIRKLHYEIEKAEADLEEIEEKIKQAKETPTTQKKPKSFWAFLSMDSDED